MKIEGRVVDTSVLASNAVGIMQESGIGTIWRKLGRIEIIGRKITKRV